MRFALSYSRIGLAAAAALMAPAPQAVSAQTLKQSVKYTLLIIAGGLADAARREGVAMSGTGIYMDRDACEAAGAGVKFGVVNPTEGQPTPTIVWVCVPLGKP